jgi:hypothetical protein
MVLKFCSSLFLINCVLEWANVLFPGWVVLWESIDGVDLSKLSDVQDLELLEFQIGVESSVVELSKVSHRVSSGKVFLLAVINRQVLIDFRFLISFDWVWDLLEMLVVGGSV